MESGFRKAWDVELGVEKYQKALRTDTPLPTMGTLGPVRYSPLNSHYIPTQITQSHLSATLIANYIPLGGRRYGHIHYEGIVPTRPGARVGVKDGIVPGVCPSTLSCLIVPSWSWTAGSGEPG